MQDLHIKKQNVKEHLRCGAANDMRCKRHEYTAREIGEDVRTYLTLGTLVLIRSALVVFGYLHVPYPDSCTCTLSNVHTLVYATIVSGFL